MTNKERQKSLENQRYKKYGDVSSCGYEDYCEYCKEVSDPYCCAKAYNRMIRKNIRK